MRWDPLTTRLPPAALLMSRARAPGRSAPPRRQVRTPRAAAWLRPESGASGAGTADIFRDQRVTPTKIQHLRGSASVPRWGRDTVRPVWLAAKVGRIMRGRWAAAARGPNARRGAGSVLLVGASAATLVVAQAATAVAAPVVTSAAGQAQQPLSAAQAAQLSQHVNQNVIVFLKDQPKPARAGTSAAGVRAGMITSNQSPLLGEFRRVHATHVRSYTLVNSVAATVSAGEEARLKANPAVQRVIPDGLIYGQSPAAPSAPAAASSAIKTLPGACLPRGGVQLEPEALPVTQTHSTVPRAKTPRSLGLTGAHVNVLNESSGSDPIPDLSDADAVKQFDDAAVAARVTVVVSSGDAGPFNSIGSPATDPNVISVGASTDFRWYAMTNYGLADDFATTGWLNDNISSLSSGGFSETGTTVDLVAPGDSSFASCDANVAKFADCTNFVGKPSNIERSGGTSQSAPLTAGAAALVIQAYEKTHSGGVPTPALVKQILLSTATYLGAPAYEQGAGLLNSYKAVQLAESINGGKPAGGTLATSTSQLNAVANPGTSESWTVSVTNEGTTAQTVRLSGRGFGPSRVVGAGSVTLSNVHTNHVPHCLGLPHHYPLLPFHAPRHQNRLSAEIAYPGHPANGNNPRVRLIPIHPGGP